MKLPRHGVIASSNFFSLDSYQDLVDIDPDFIMTETIINIPRKQASYWTIQWENNSVMSNIQKKSLWLHVLKCDKDMSERQFNSKQKFDLLHPESECKQELKRCLTVLSHHKTFESVLEQIMTPTQKSIKCSKNSVGFLNFNSKVCGECVFKSSYVSTTSPDDDSPVKPAPSIKTEEAIDESDSSIDDIEGLNSESVTLFQDINQDSGIDPLYKPDFM